jgi:hypothetical protein
VFVAADHIISMFFAGLTVLKMTSGERIEVKETRKKSSPCLPKKPPNDYHTTGSKRAHRLPGERRRAVDQRDKVMALAKAFKQLAAENVELKAAIDATIGWQQSTDVENVESVRMLSISMPRHRSHRSRD